MRVESSTRLVATAVESASCVLPIVWRLLASALYVSTIHGVDHQRMRDDPSGTVPELTSSAERLFTSALATAEELVVLDPGLVKQVTARWVEALHALAR